MQETGELKLTDVDFLPVAYREQNAMRRARMMRLIAGGVVAWGIALAALIQHQNWQRADRKLQEILPQHAAAEALHKRLAKLQEDLKQADHRARLVTYLKHPWPRTRILEAVFAPLPQQITVRELTLTRTEHDKRLGQLAQALPDEEKMPEPAHRNLARLRTHFDAATTTVLLEGNTADVSQLHAYMDELAQHPLIEKAELRSIQHNTGVLGGSDFRLRIAVSRPHGQGPLSQDGKPTVPDA